MWIYKFNESTCFITCKKFSNILDDRYRLMVQSGILTRQMYISHWLNSTSLLDPFICRIIQLCLKYLQSFYPSLYSVIMHSNMHVYLIVHWSHILWLSNWKLSSKFLSFLPLITFITYNSVTDSWGQYNNCHLIKCF